MKIKGCFIPKTPLPIRQGSNIRAVRTCGKRGAHRSPLDVPENLDILAVGIIDTYIIACGKVTSIPGQLYIVPSRVLNDRDHRLRHTNLNLKGCFITKTPLPIRQGSNVCTVRSCRERSTHRGSLNIPENFDILTVGVIDAYIIACGKVTGIPRQLHVITVRVLTSRHCRLCHSNLGNLNIKGRFVTKTPISIGEGRNIRTVRTCGERSAHRGSLHIPENLDILAVGIIDAYIIASGKVTRVPRQLHVVSGRVPIDRSYRLRDPNLRSRIGKCWSYQAILERFSSARSPNLNLIVPLDFTILGSPVAIYIVNGTTFYACNKNGVAFRRIAITNNIPCLHSRQSIDFIPISSTSTKNPVCH